MLVVTAEGVVHSLPTPQSKARCCQIRCQTRLSPPRHPATPFLPGRPRLSSSISPLLLLFILPLPKRLGAVPAGPGFNPESPKPEGSQGFLSPSRLAPVALGQWLGSLGTFSPHTHCTS